MQGVHLRRQVLELGEKMLELGAHEPRQPLKMMRREIKRSRVNLVERRQPVAPKVRVHPRHVGFSADPLTAEIKRGTVGKVLGEQTPTNTPACFEHNNRHAAV
eukprot:Amastigsp_a341570_40.p4 type:complete len:103 gc:universal Amastigsp_a341570_40:549-241(-)